jgi:thiamine-monophosphate kinase
MVRRAAARPGDVLYVSGTLGDATLGLTVLTDPAATAAWRLTSPETEHLIARYRRPQPRLGLRHALLDHARAAMDLSDGLAKDLARMANASGIAAIIKAARLPLSAAAARALAADPALITRIVTGGDDYEVIAAVPPDRAQAFEAAAARDGIAVTAIGHCQDGGGITIMQGSEPLTLTRLGYDHF